LPSGNRYYCIDAATNLSSGRGETTGVAKQISTRQILILALEVAMRGFRTLACILSVLSSSSLAGSALGQSSEYFRIVEVAPGDVLNMRSAPDPAAPISGTIPSGATGVERAGECKAWCQVKYGGITGWVNRRFLQPVAAAATTQDLADAINDCNSDENERRLRGCSSLIERREFAKDAKALAYSRRSDAYLDRRDFNRAIADRLEALILAPSDADYRARLMAAYLARGEQFRSKGDDSRATADYTAALRYDTANHIILSARAAAYARTNQHEEAIADYRAALALEPSSERYRLALGALLHKRASTTKRSRFSMKPFASTKRLRSSTSAAAMLTSPRRTLLPR